MIRDPSPTDTVPHPVRVAVAAPHHLAVDAAREVVTAGGGAVDAALAAAMTLTVVYPHQCSLGGDLFALVRRPDGSTTCIDASGRYGSGGLPAGGRVPVTGPLSVTVPGVVSGWEALHDLGGRLPVARLLAPARRLAGAGVAVTERLAAAIAEVDLRGPGGSGLDALLTDRDGERLGAGAVLRQPPLAASLAALASDGLHSFYDGRLGDDVASACARLGVPITREDLRGHTSTLIAPLTVQASGCRISTAPPPSQGYLLLSTVLAVERLAGTGVEVDAGVLRELFALTGERRDAELADPDHMSLPGADLIDGPHVERDVRTVVGRLREGYRPAGVPSPQPGGDTVAVTVVGDDGTAVSLIQSLFHYFGSRVHDATTGITFHNRAAGFSPVPGVPNSVAAGKRPAHTLMPVLVEHDDGRIAAQGAMGGRQQPQIHAQVLRRRLAGAGAQDAVSAPRFVVVPLEAPGSYGVLAEPSLGEPTLRRLRGGGRPVRLGSVLDEAVGHAMACVLLPDGTLDAGADPRSDGAVWVGG